MKKFFSVLVVTFLFILGGCKEEILLPEMMNGEDGISTIFAFDVLAPTDDHLNGGWVMQVGGDLNKNGTLDPDEIQANVPLWHGNDGINGTNGINGLDGAAGTVVGISEDGFWVLDGVVTEFKALGIDGTNGTNGTNGEDGKSPYVGEDGYWYYWNVETNTFVTTNIKAQGEKGDKGDTGATPNIVFLTLDVDPTETHTNGGILVTMVWDKDGDQEIDEEDIIGMYTVWHGNDGANGEDGDTPFINEEGYWQINEYVTQWQAQGPQGPQGPKGDKGDTGVDGFSPYVNEGGYWVFMINSVEIVSTIPATGPQGPKGDKGDKGETVGYTVSTADNCGGVSGYRVTIDTDPVQWFEVCDGKVGETGLTGFQYLVRTSEKENGCFTIEFGLDINRNDVLDDDEVNDLQTQTVCDGLATLFVMSPKVDGCFTIYSGLDANYNGILERDEVNEANTSEVCDGTSILVDVFVDEGNCVTVTYFMDVNYNGEIDEGDDFVSEYTICDGETGEQGDGSLVTISRSDNAGCILVKTWIDTNNNGEVDDGDELVDTAEVCNGAVGPVGPRGQIGPRGRNGSDGDDGLNSLIKLCERGGCVYIYIGLDRNENGRLDAFEVTQSAKVCDGETGPAGEIGPEGPQGPAGPVGPQGPAGNVDLNAKIDICHYKGGGRYQTLNVSIMGWLNGHDGGTGWHNKDYLGACNPQ